jgi:hypothetical protein
VVEKSSFYTPEKPSKSANPIFRNSFNLNGGSNLIKPNQTNKIFLPFPVLSPRSSILPEAGRGEVLVHPSSGSGLLSTLFCPRPLLLNPRE